MSDLQDIIFSHGKRDSDLPWKYPDHEVSWWYVYESENENDEDPYKEGIYVSVHTKNNIYGISLSTETVVEMYKTLISHIAETDDVGVSIEAV